jgi:outer membrane protein OmpA-like peptidoglycan-associated protein
MKNYLSILFISLLCHSVFAQQKISFYDDFSRNDNGWSESSTEKITTKVTDGHYELYHKRSSGGYCFYDDYFMETKSDFYFESKMMQTIGETNHGYGLVWGGKNASNCYNFMISSNGYYRIGEWTEGKFKGLTEWVKTTANNPMLQYNTLAVERKKNMLYFYVNGTEIHKRANLPLKGLKFGFNLKAAMKVKADYMKLDYSGEKINVVENSINNYIKVNLGKNINSNSTEKAPKISHDGKILYYTRAKHPENDGEKDDAWMAKATPNETWYKAETMGKPINNKGNNFVVSSSPDNNTLFVGNTYNADGTEDGSGVSVTNRTRTGWEIPKKVVIDDYYNDNKYVNVCFAPSKTVMILAIERKNSEGDQDLYYSKIKSDGTWTAPKTMGSVLNTLAADFSPFLAADNRTLYFASQGHPGYGNADVFVSKRIGSGWENWTVPQNLGPEINTNKWDAYFTVPASGKYAYLVSTKNSLGSTDVFRIKLKEDELTEITEPSREEMIVKNNEEEEIEKEVIVVKSDENLRPEDDITFVDPVVIVFGRVLDAESKKPLEASLIYETLLGDANNGVATSNPATGEYKIILPYGNHYGFTAKAKNHISVSDNVDIEGEGKFIEIEKNFYLTPLEVGKPVRVNNVFFDRSKHTLLEKSYPELDRLVKFMQDNKSIEIRIEGHTDGIGNPVELMKLSWDRVAAVKQYLYNKGITEKRIDGKGYGRSKPIAPNNTEDNRKKNRRVEFVITKL